MVETQLLRSAQIAALLQEHDRTIVRWVRQRHLRGFKLGKGGFPLRTFAHS